MGDAVTVLAIFSSAAGEAAADVQRTGHELTTSALLCSGVYEVDDISAFGALFADTKTPDVPAGWDVRAVPLLDDAQIDIDASALSSAELVIAMELLPGAADREGRALSKEVADRGGLEGLSFVVRIGESSALIAPPSGGASHASWAVKR